jgi:PAS domain S-box-containing protein
MSDVHPITRALMQAMSSSDQPMVLSDPRLPDNPMIAVNPTFLALTGYTWDEAVGRNCRFLQGPETDRTTAARIGRCLAERRGCVEWIVNRRRDGSVFWNLLFISPVFDHDGTLLHFFGNQRDVTNSSPAESPQITFGKADMPAEGKLVFHRALLDIIDATPADDGTLLSRRLDRVVEAARQIDEVTRRLDPAPWSLPPR